jgi:WD40 repeat protein
VSCIGDHELIIRWSLVRIQAGPHQPTCRLPSDLVDPQRSGCQGRPETSRVEPQSAGRRRRAYDAFISYSRTADGKLGPALQRGLQRFAKPWYRLRALRVFRDDASLSANPDLWGSIEQALDDSEYFILLASPPAAESQWVAKEVEYWLEHRGTERLLVVLTEGELFWVPGHGVDRSRTSALPAPLYDAFDGEPRYVDLRWARTDGQLGQRDTRFRDALADLAAPLHGRSKDEMLGEEVRQHKRTLAVAWSAAAVLAALTVAASVLALLAVQQRNRARTQASIALSRQLAAQSATQLDGPTAVSPVLALEAYRRVRTQPAERSYDARNAMLVALQRSPRLVATLATPDLRAAAFSPDGKTVVTGSGNGTLRFWDSRDGRPLGPPRIGLRSSVTTLAYSPDGKIVAVGDEKGQVTFWDATRRTRRNEAVRAARSIILIVFSPDSRELAVIGSDGPSWQPGADRVRVLQMHDLRQPPQLLGEAEDLTLQDAAFTADGAALVTTDSYYDARVWTVRGPTRRLRAHTAYDVTNARDGRVLLLAKRRGGAQLVDAFSGKPGGPTLPVHGDDRVDAAPGGRVFISGSMSQARPATLWKIRGRRVAREPLTKPQVGYALPIFSPDGTMFALFGQGGDQTLELFEARRENPFATVLRPGRPFVEAPSAVAVAPRVAAAVADSTALTFWNGRRGGGMTRTLKSTPESLALSPDGSLLAAGGLSGDVTFWDTKRHRKVPSPRSPNGAPVWNLTFSADGKKLSARGADGLLQVWDTSRRPPRLRSRTKTAPPPTCPREANADEGSCAVAPTTVAVAPDGTLVYGTLSGVRFWDPARRVSSELGANANEVALTPDGVILAAFDTLSDRSAIQLWDLSRHQPIGRPLRVPPDTLALAFGSGGAELISGGTNGSVTIWDRQLFSTNFDSWRTRLCRLAGRNLTTEEWAQFLPGERYRKTCPALP